MLTTSILDLLTGAFQEKVTDITQTFDPDIKDHQLYLFLDGKLALYAGQSRHILLRIKDHIMGDGKVGRLIRANFPQSYDWQVHLFTIRECINIHWDIQERIHERLKKLGVPVTPIERRPLPDFSVRDAEEALIQYHSPCLNLTPKPRKRRLPSTYNLPQSSELLDGLSSLDWRESLSEWIVSYKAFDWSIMENKQHKNTVRAPSYKDCKRLVTRFLGYEPEELRIVSALRYEPDDTLF